MQKMQKMSFPIIADITCFITNITENAEAIREITDLIWLDDMLEMQYLANVCSHSDTLRHVLHFFSDTLSPDGK